MLLSRGGLTEPGGLLLEESLALLVPRLYPVDAAASNTGAFRVYRHPHPPGPLISTGECTFPCYFSGSLKKRQQNYASPCVAQKTFYKRRSFHHVTVGSEPYLGADISICLIREIVFTIGCTDGCVKITHDFCLFCRETQVLHSASAVTVLPHELCFTMSRNKQARNRPQH